MINCAPRFNLYPFAISSSSRPQTLARERDYSPLVCCCRCLVIFMAYKHVAGQTAHLLTLLLGGPEHTDWTGLDCEPKVDMYINTVVGIEYIEMLTERQSSDRVE